ncbi:hypothetical protein AAE021_10175 [Arthrobacter citreus]|uniref:Uncharacterized protein n=1 Tax=Arthrobacter citreus TaxID=1670 RepID=A0ABZ2ZTN7_9MICC
MKNLPLSLTLAALSGALTLRSPADWSPAWRRAFVLVPGAVLGVTSGVAVLKGSRKGRELAAAGRVDLVSPAASRSGDGAAGTAPLPSYVRADAPARVPVLAVTGLAATVGVTVSGVLALTLALDEWLETWLVRRGVARPRLVMAAMAAVSSLGLDQLTDAEDSEE